MGMVLTVSEINRYIKEIVSRDALLCRIWVKGEISNYKSHYSGHMYFTLKDEFSIVKCVMFKSQAAGLKFVPENGMKVIIKGSVSVFERDGQYQLYAEEMQPDGLGNLHMAFEQLKKKLSEEGLFDQKYKKKLPFLPRKIGVVTSSTGAVIRDIINVLGRRFNNVGLKIFPVAVQGAEAPKQIARAVRLLNEKKAVEVIIVARGGGSLEELWAFNEEIVARSIFESDIPVISAVGHETDFTIADFVADLRAPTPSAAAELVIPEKAMLQDKVSNIRTRLRNALYSNVAIKRSVYDRIVRSPVFKQPFDRVYQERMKLGKLDRDLTRALEVNQERVKSNLGLLVGKLDALSPLGILARGYSIAKNKKDGKLIKSVVNVKNGDELEIDVNDGKINCTVDDIQKK